MRVHELAKEYGIKSTEFVDIIQEFGIDIKSHLSSLDDAQVATVRNQMSNKEQVEAAQDYALEERFNQEELTPEVKEWVSGETVISKNEIEVVGEEQIEEIVEEVVESLSQEVVVEPPRGFLGWLRSLFS